MQLIVTLYKRAMQIYGLLQRNKAMLINFIN